MALIKRQSSEQTPTSFSDVFLDIVGDILKNAKQTDPLHNHYSSRPFPHEVFTEEYAFARQIPNGIGEVTTEAELLFELEILSDRLDIYDTAVQKLCVYYKLEEVESLKKGVPFPGDRGMDYLKDLAEIKKKYPYSSQVSEEVKNMSAERASYLLLNMGESKDFEAAKWALELRWRASIPSETPTLYEVEELFRGMLEEIKLEFSRPTVEPEEPNQRPSPENIAPQKGQWSEVYGERNNSQPVRTSPRV